MKLGMLTGKSTVCVYKNKLPFSSDYFLGIQRKMHHVSGPVFRSRNLKTYKALRLLSPRGVIWA
ncbi:hypothetical protein HMPREF1870_00587 [Bacteroidales bacterium KA00344]|nr:hypothetical protein HMPREF1870_00587 [Bacteroidales bacterium KA00344]